MLFHGANAKNHSFFMYFELYTKLIITWFFFLLFFVFGRGGGLGGVGYFLGGGGVSFGVFYSLCKVFLSSTSYSRVKVHACADSLKRNRI